MRRPWRRRANTPTDDELADMEYAQRTLRDAKALGQYANELSRSASELEQRAEKVRAGWQETREVNHIARAFVDAIERKVRHP